MNRIKCEVLSDLENGVIDQMVAAQESGTQAAQTTNSRYVAALGVYEEFLRSAEYINGDGFRPWLKACLNPPKAADCT